jgi:hypothetical protein
VHVTLLTALLNNAERGIMFALRTGAEILTDVLQEHSELWVVMTGVRNPSQRVMIVTKEKSLDTSVQYCRTERSMNFSGENLPETEGIL